jgi:hypothetical protein
MLGVSSYRRAAATLLLLAALSAGSAIAQDREDPRGPHERSRVRSFIAWLMDTLSAPPG